MLDLTRPVNTKDGREVWIYTTKHPGDRPIVGSVHNKDGSVIVETWREDGSYFCNDSSEMDLENASNPFTRRAWVNVYRDNDLSIHFTKREAEINSTGQRIACVNLIIEVKEGDGL